MSETVITIMEIVGTIAVAMSGALIAVRCNLDVFGVVFIGVITAVGGGMLRDILVGNCPPSIFYNTDILILAALTSIAVFIIAYINKYHFETLREKIERINNIFDAIGLSAFTVTGAEVAFYAGYGDKIIFVVLMGMITGVGGGIFRDILVSKTPYVLKKHVYALASIAGGIVYYLIRTEDEKKVIGTVASIVTVFAIRMLATRYMWSLPKVNLKEDAKGNVIK